MFDLENYDYLVTAAGRVNVIGEHIDYCGGKVLPAALSLKNKVYIRPNNTNTINLSWTTLPDNVSLDIDKLESYKGLKYGNYQAGSLLMWQQAGHKLMGCDMLQSCEVPFGSGLSSSAAIEVSTIAAMATLTGEALDKKEIALLAQKAEREYVGMNCGIMDQYVSAFGKKGYALLLDCNKVEHKYIPLDLGEYSLVLIDCNKPHSLVESKYNERRAETETALNLLKRELNITCLAEVKPQTLQAYSYLLPSKILKRAEHVVGECERVGFAVAAMKAGNIEVLGKLLNKSHESLSKLYEVTGRELDTLANIAQNHPACLGSRMTGGGFGGCTVSCVKTSKINEFEKCVGERYLLATGYNAKFYKTEISDGITVTKL